MSNLDHTERSVPSVAGIQFRFIDRFPGYAFGSDGSVWTCWKVSGLSSRLGSKNVRSSEWRVLNGTLAKRACEYRCVAIRRIGDTRRKNFLVHSLILEAFCGPRPSGNQGCHNNGIGTDNRIENLRWDTPKGNTADKFRHGTVRRGSNHGFSKLTEEKVIEIRSRRASGESASELANEFNVHVRTISRVYTRRIWTHV